MKNVDVFPSEIPPATKPTASLFNQNIPRQNKVKVSAVGLGETEHQERGYFFGQKLKKSVYSIRPTLVIICKESKTIWKLKLNCSGINDKLLCNF